MKLPWGGDSVEQTQSFKPLDNGAGFLLDIEGRKVVALKLPGNVAKEVAGQKSVGGSVFARLAKLWRSVEPEHWLIVANMQNGSMNDPGKFEDLVAENLGKASGVIVPTSDLVIVGGKVSKTEEQGAPIVT